MGLNLKYPMNIEFYPIFQNLEVSTSVDHYPNWPGDVGPLGPAQHS